MKPDNTQRIIASFDVFDTCLTRRVAMPTDIFLECSHTMSELVGRHPTLAFEEEFRWARDRGEQLARQESPYEDVTLSEVWEKTRQLLGR
jgi:hypothetical protein